MTERSQVIQFLEKADMTLQHAEKVFEDSLRIEQGDPGDYTQAQLELEGLNEELDALIHSATPEQREELNRKQQQLRQLQNHFILKR